MLKRNDLQEQGSSAGELPHANARSGRSMGRADHSLADTLDKELKRSGKSIYQLSNESGVDAAYIWRILRGERQNVSREVLIALSIALASEPGQVDRVFNVVNEMFDAAGFRALR